MSVVDLLSGGRVEIGVGSGGSSLEYAAFGADVGRKRELTSEGLRVLRDALAGREVGTDGFAIQPPPGDFTGRLWQAVFSAGGAGYAAAASSNGSGCPGSFSRPRTRRPRSTRSARTCTPPRRFHSFYGHPDEIIAGLRQERVLPVATDLITQFNPAVPDQDAAIRALELIATEIAPAPGWKPASES